MSFYYSIRVSNCQESGRAITVLFKFKTDIFLKSLEYKQLERNDSKGAAEFYLVLT